MFILCTESSDIVQQVMAGFDLLANYNERLARSFDGHLHADEPLDFLPCDQSRSLADVHVTLASISREEAIGMIMGPSHLHSWEVLQASTQMAITSAHGQDVHDVCYLLRTPQGRPVKCCLLLGQAGSGKTLTALKILFEWTHRREDSPFERFGAIVHLTGRERKRLAAKNVHDLLQLRRLHYNEQQQLAIIDYFSSHSEKVLFLIDGWDESGIDDLQGNSVLEQILRGTLFSKSSIIVTSRRIRLLCLRSATVGTLSQASLTNISGRHSSSGWAKQVLPAFYGTYRSHVMSMLRWLYRIPHCLLLCFRMSTKSSQLVQGRSRLSTRLC